MHLLQDVELKILRVLPMYLSVLGGIRLLLVNCKVPVLLFGETPQNVTYQAQHVWDSPGKNTEWIPMPSSRGSS